MRLMYYPGGFWNGGGSFLTWLGFELFIFVLAAAVFSIVYFERQQGRRMRAAMRFVVARARMFRAYYEWLQGSGGEIRSGLIRVSWRARRSWSAYEHLRALMPEFKADDSYIAMLLEVRRKESLFGVFRGA